jgi:hypothetical protein
MATWKRLTDVHSGPIDVNTKNIASIRAGEERTTIIFAGGQNDGKPLRVAVKEALTKFMAQSR